MRNDIQLTENFDLLIEAGDFVVDQSDNQHIKLLIELHKGNIKQYPLTGVGVERLLNGSIDGAIRAEIQRQLEADGYRAKSIEYSDNQLIVKV